MAIFCLDPDELHHAGLALSDVAAHQVAAEVVPKVRVSELRPVDLIACGSARC